MRRYGIDHHASVIAIADEFHDSPGKPADIAMFTKLKHGTSALEPVLVFVSFCEVFVNCSELLRCLVVAMQEYEVIYDSTGIDSGAGAALAGQLHRLDSRIKVALASFDP